MLPDSRKREEHIQSLEMVSELVADLDCYHNILVPYIFHVKAEATWNRNAGLFDALETCFLGVLPLQPMRADVGVCALSFCPGIRTEMSKPVGADVHQHQTMDLGQSLWVQNHQPSSCS